MIQLSNIFRKKTLGYTLIFSIYKYFLLVFLMFQFLAVKYKVILGELNNSWIV